MLLLDTNILVDILRRRPRTYLEPLDRALGGGEEVRTSSVCLHELVYGAMRSGRPEPQLELVYSLVERIEVDPWNAEDALVAARLRVQLDGLGQPIGSYDVQIAAHALRLKAALVTRNLRHFVRPGTLLDELPLIDWSVSDRPLDRDSLIASLRRAQED